MTELIDIEGDSVDYSKMMKECTMDLDLPVDKPDVIIYYGFDDRGERVPLMTRGEMSAIVAQSKTKKSYNKSLIEAACFGGKTDSYTNHILANTNNKGWIISVDTEQGKFYAHNTFKRPEKIAGHRHPKYKPITLRGRSIDERLKLIDWLVFDSEYAGDIDLLFIDGIADLVYNTNNIEEGVMIGEKLLKWTSVGDLHASVIIHKTGNSDKARGHTGTAVQIKCESIIIMDSLTDEQGKFIKNKQGYPERNTVKIRNGMSRGKNFEDFYLRIDEDGLPFTFDDPDNPQHPKDIFKESVPLPVGDVNTAFDNKPNEDEVPF